jgi:5-methyltetrahydrofolate--homocysteine methyltransferase
MNKLSFQDRIKKGDILVSDGAMGTNLQKQGLEKGKPSENWLFERPEEIVQLHKDFIDAGSDIILTNTFGASEIRLKVSKSKESVKAVNRRAVEIAKDAVGNKDVFVAGSIGPSGGFLEPLGSLSEKEMFSSFSKQTKALADAGVDLFVVETQFDLREAMITLRAVRDASDLPLVCSFSYDRGTRTMMGVTPNEMAQELNTTAKDLEIIMFGINCGRSIDENIEALKELNLETELPIWFKPNAGIPKIDENGDAIYELSPHEMGKYVDVWVESGAKVIGGCCGTSARHLGEISKSVKKFV